MFLKSCQKFQDRKKGLCGTMKILMLNYEYPPLGGGGGNVARALAEELVASGHSVDVVTMGFKGLKTVEIINGVTVYRLSCIRKKKEACKSYEMLSYCISANKFLQKLLLENEYDINHTHFIIPTGIVSYLNRKNIPYILTAHGSDVPGHNPDKFSFEHKLVKPLWDRIIKSSCKIVTPSEYLKDLILKNVSTDNIEVINSGFNASELSPKKKEKKILLVGRLIKLKGYQYFLDAIRDLRLDYEINIVGDGPYKKELMEKAKGIETEINFVGWLDNKSSQFKNLIESSSIFVHPSYAETFSIVLLEAMAAGCAIITTNTTGCPEVVGDSALLVRPKNPDDIKSALLKLINEDKLRHELGITARRRVEQNFSWEKISQDYSDLYSSLQLKKL